MRNLVIIGVGGVGRALRFFVDDVNADGGDWRLEGFLDDDPATHGSVLHGLPVLGPMEWLSDHRDRHALLALGDPRARSTAFDRLSAMTKIPPVTLVHPKAYVGPNVRIGAGTLLYPGACVEPDAVIGEAVLINQNATLGHDTQAERFATLAPAVAVAGGVVLGEGCNLGIGCSVIQDVRIGPWVIVGAGAAVISDLPERVTAVGVPARVLRGE